MQYITAKEILLLQFINKRVYNIVRTITKRTCVILKNTTHSLQNE